VEHQVLGWITQYGYLAIFLLLMFGIVGLPVPDETLLTFSGYLVYAGHLSLPLAFGTALAGSVSGITVSYWLGRNFGMKLIHRYGRYIHVTEKHVQKAHAWFERVGHWGLTFGYFVPGVRHLTAYAAGMSDVEPHMFAVFAYSGAAMWVATFVGIGYFLGERWKSVQEHVEGYLVAASVAGAVVLVGYLLWRRLRRKGSAA